MSTKNKENKMIKREEKVLHKDKWLSLRTVKYGDSPPITYMHEDRCNGEIISILPYRVSTEKNILASSVRGIMAYDIKKEFLIREETIYSWHYGDKEKHDLLIRGTVTGGVEDDDPVTTVIHEMLEETGYVVRHHQLEKLGTSRASKASDTLYHIYAVDLTNIEKVAKPTGDGSAHEKLSRSVWVKESEILMKMQDPMFYVAYTRMGANEWKQ
jgi:hypothetical protein